jgi:hypothetical protein
MAWQNTITGARKIRRWKKLFENQERRNRNYQLTLGGACDLKTYCSAAKRNGQDRQKRQCKDLIEETTAQVRRFLVKKLLTEFKSRERKKAEREA